MKLNIPLLRRHAIRPHQAALSNKVAVAEALRTADANGDLGSALRHCQQLVGLDPREPRWLRRQGDLQRRLGDVRGAAQAYMAAAGSYERQGLSRHASALTRLAVGLDPSTGTTAGGAHPMLLESSPLR